MSVKDMQIKQEKKPKGEGIAASERKGKETKTGKRIYNLRQRLTESGSERAVLHQAPLSG